MALPMDQGSYFRQQTAAPPDLHDLVTSHLDTSEAEPFAVSRSSWAMQPTAGAPFASAMALHPRHADHTQHLDYTQQSNHTQHLDYTQQSDHTQHLDYTQQSDYRPSQPYTDLLQQTSSIQTAEKARDNPNSVARTRSFEPERAIPTSTRLNRLFASPIFPTFSPETSYRNVNTNVRSASSDSASLNTHLYMRGLLGGKHSDITVHVFGHAYALHRIILDRAPFFASALTEPWIEASCKEVTLHPEDIDPSITKLTFELALRRLYGCETEAEEESEARGLFATGCWLEMQDLIDASTAAILRQMQPRSLGHTIQLVTNSYYGKPGGKILASAKAMLCRDGWSMPLSHWESVPSEVIREVVGGDGLFISGEWDRWVLARLILDQRLRPLAIEAGLLTSNCIEAPKILQASAQRPRGAGTERADDALTESSVETSRLGDWLGLYAHPDIEPLLELLDNGIYYMHLGFEHLQLIRAARDCLGVPLVPDGGISNALWKSLELRQNILNAHDSDEELGLAFGPPEADVAQDDHASVKPADKGAHSRRFWIPSADCNIVVGGSGDPVVTASNGGAQRSLSDQKTVQPADAVQWFSDFTKERSQASSASTPDLRPATYSTFPPFRFAANFPHPRTLKEKKRVYSQTVFYAGSHWNVYVQKVRTGTKSPQLGVYLHRARDGESLADPSDSTLGAANTGARGSVDDRIGALEREMLLRSERRSRRHSDRHMSTTSFYSAGADHDGRAGSNADSALLDSTDPAHNALSVVSADLTTATSTRADGYTFIATPGADSSSSSPEPHRSPSQAQRLHQQQQRRQQQQQQQHTVSALPAYADARPTIKTYFKIYSPSKGGRMLSVYESAPDCFNFSQSWGWKSSTLMVDDAGLDAEADALGGSLAANAAGHRGGAIGGAHGLGADDDGDEPAFAFGDEQERGDKMPRDDGKLRFMIVLGVV